ncbi:PAS/PAC sensor hybrid histidine kinase [Magnetococcus marinus MC-1]|uniref:histidine kinase n=1 Tax=Magnetococcus marinus (strain ATCC BAA-1437 / JCM 17883 / MC-1) TaxID=156889 RepID=A0LBU9_MAGMM|nr:PAS domain S-box protein [Magnetococcus marinus]ABK45442.1 PAS/PAC sensor hybrid histidine kinase [Magnetococcus marinus MC-1]
MDHRNSLLTLYMVMVVAVVAVAAGLLLLLYQDSFAKKQAHLQDLATNQARLIDEVANFNHSYRHDYPTGAVEATISQIRDAHGKSIGFGQTGEFIIAYRKSGHSHVHFIVAHRFTQAVTPSFRENPNHLHPAMARAMAGESGFMEGTDYRGKQVLIAYAPVVKLRMGVVAKMDVQEVLAPFERILKIGLSITLLLIGGGSVAYLWVAKGVAGRMEWQHQRLAMLVEGMPAVIYTEDLRTQLPYYVSPQAVVLLGGQGCQADEPLDVWWNRHVWAEDWETLQHARQMLKKHKRPMQVEYRMVRQDGQLIWVRDVARLVCDEQGLPLLVQGMVMDVSEARHTHEKLIASEVRFRQLYENAPIAYQSLNTEGVIQNVNQAWLKKTGYELSQVLDHSLFEFLVVGQEQEVAKKFEAFLQAGYVQDLHYELRCADGRALKVSINGQVSRDRSGRLVKTHCVLTDITEQDRAAQALQESESRLRLILASTGEGLFGLDLQGNFIFANPACLRMMGYRDDRQLLGKPMLEIVSCCSSQFVRRGKGSCPISQILKTGLPNHAEGELFRRADGSFFSTEFWSHPIQQNGELVGAVVTFIDISQRVLNQTALKASELKYRTIFESVPTPLLILDTSGVVRDVNSAHQSTFGRFAGGSLMGVSIREHPGVAGSLLAESFLALAKGEPMPLQQASYTMEAEGEAIHFNVRGVPFVTRDGEGREDLQGALVIHENITDLKQTELKLRKAVEEADCATHAKGDFLAVMSHEIRTPMNLVVGMAELLLETDVNAEQKHYLEKLQKAGDTLLSLINNILDLTKLDEGQLKLLDEPFAPQALLDEVSGIISLAAEAKGLTLSCEIQEGVPERVLGDSVRIKQVLLNLLSNALKFTQQGFIRLSLTVEGAEGAQQLCYAVSDSGMGIPDYHLDEVFERFSQGDSSMTRRFGGSGLGLAICKKLVILMQGQIQVSSQVDVGAIFQIRLPLRAAALAPASSQQQVKRRLNQGVRVLLAEDAVDNRMLIQAYLRNSPHDLVMVEDGQQALQLIEEGTDFNLILMDVQMPVMDGYSATRAILAELGAQQRPPCPIVALTAHALEGDQARSLQAGCVAHLTKPIKKKILLEAIQTYARLAP